MNNKDFITTLSQHLGYSVEETQRMVDIVIETMSDHFQEDNSLLVPNFGTFEVKKKMERIEGMNDGQDDNTRYRKQADGAQGPQ